MSETTPTLSIYETKFAPSDKTDAILVVDGKKLHVNKALLSIHSDYFNTLFNSDFKEKSQAEIEIKDVNFEDFATLLSLVHPDPIKVTDTNAEKILELADRFLLPLAKNHLESALMLGKMDKIEKIRIADKYGLEDLMIHGLDQYTSQTNFNGLRLTQKFVELSDETKIKLFLRMLVLMGY